MCVPSLLFPGGFKGPKKRPEWLLAQLYLILPKTEQGEIANSGEIGGNTENNTKNPLQKITKATYLFCDKGLDPVNLAVAC